MSNPNADDNVELEPDDRIFIRSIPEYHRKNYVSVYGEVVYPGYYVIEEGVTKLSDVIRVAGGFTDRASLQESKLIRRAREEVVDPEFERLKLMAVEDMTDIEYEYFKTKSRQVAGIVAVDFEKLFGEGDVSQDILLRNKDIIQIQPLTETVNIFITFRTSLQKAKIYM